MKDINFFNGKGSFYFKKIHSKSEISEKDNCDGYFISSSEKEARRIIDFLKGRKLIAFEGEDNRRAIEKLKINFLVSPEKFTKKDTLKQRDSGLNHVVAKEASKRKIPILINLSELRMLNKKEKIRRISRIIQNIEICKKVNCKIKIANFSPSKKDLVDEKGRMALGISLGMSTQQAKDSVNFKTI